MKLLRLLLCTLSVAGERSLIWEDNFDGDGLDETVWTIKTGNGCDQGDGLCGWGNAEQQTYTEDNHAVRDGVLAITADRLEEQRDERWYTSSRIRSMAPVAFLTGRIEARIQLPVGLGLWAAFWMLPSNSSRGSWAATGEIDIMESINDMDTILGTIHYGGEYPANRYAGCKSGQLGSGLDYSDDYHLYAIEWEQDEMRWYVDDQLYCQRTKWESDGITSLAPYRAPFDTEFELILNLAVGGLLPGRRVDDSIFPATMLVDYVRVYNISTDVPEAAPFLGLPACLPGTIEAEAFDTGGLGLGFGETEPAGESGTYRVDGTGLVYSKSGVTFVANLTDTDWLAYTVATEEAVYDITLQVSTAEAADISLVIGEGLTCAAPGDGSITGDVNVAATGEGVWGAEVISGVAMPAGTHSLKLCVGGGVGINVDSIKFDLEEGAAASGLTFAECATTGQIRPYMSGEPWTLPGYMEAEYYDYGGQGLGYHKNRPGTFEGDSTLRLPDAVGVREAESNPSHGHYVGWWETGEWLSFTAVAEEAGFWDVGASVASGENGSTTEFRILVNATNCSSPDTDGLNGLGDEGVDLLNGPLTAGWTGSWEAFEMIYKEGVHVPEGAHRFLFCADGGVFNLNYLRVWTPAPTLAPTMAPTVAPTPAPQVPSDDGVDTKWIYIGVATAVVFLAFSRLGFIIYSKETSRRKPDSDVDLEPAYMPSKGPAGAGAAIDESEQDSGGTPSSEGDGGGNGEGGLLSLQGRGRLSDRDMGPGDVAWAADAGGGGGGGGAKTDADSTAVLQQQKYRDLFGIRRELSSSRRLSSSSFQEESPTTSNTKANAVSQAQHGRQALLGQNGAGGAPRGAAGAAALSSTYPNSAFHSTPGRARAAPISRSNSSAQLQVSPVDRVIPFSSEHGVAEDGSLPFQTPRAKSGLEVQRSGSLWDRSTVSPIMSRHAAAAAASAPSTPKVTPPQGAAFSSTEKSTELPPRRSSGGRDQFEDALLRALDDKWENGRSTSSAQQGIGSTPPMPPQRTISRSESFAEGPSSMLSAVKTWTCQCAFENSVGQTSCLGCGRVAPLSRPTTPARRRLPPHRMNSKIEAPSVDAL